MKRLILALALLSGCGQQYSPRQQQAVDRTTATFNENFGGLVNTPRQMTIVIDEVLESKDQIQIRWHVKEQPDLTDWDIYENNAGLKKLPSHPVN